MNIFLSVGAAPYVLPKVTPDLLPRPTYAAPLARAIIIGDPTGGTSGTDGAGTTGNAASTASNTNTNTGTGAAATTSNTPTTSTPTDTVNTSTAVATTSAATPTTSSNTNTATNTTPIDTNTSTSTNTANTSGSGTTSPPAQQTTQPPASPTVSESLSTQVTTGQDGQQTTLVHTVTETLASSSESATNTPSADQGNSGSSGSSTSKSTIIGLSVAGGIALIGVIAFAVWKFTRKRFSDDFDDSEAIKWPDLNGHSDNEHALPTGRAPGAAFETSSEVNLMARPDSARGVLQRASAVDLYSTSHDPYAVPPLPHLNPNVTQPYRDDPNAYYDHDPYSGAPPPVGEAIPMTQIGRARSPGPQAAFGGYPDGRASPGPGQALGVAPQVARSRSPAPAPGYSGRMSPGPQAGRMSPGPQMAYGPGAGY
ncbi:hypothetical protein A0H81_07676 [Grifola frondosa]|uniref:Uncharacterized protein n=1 Tax=Grifola frondosa TaxID=5627 RepID=A0A1C7M6V8_GRIFR|nr:hypothetical protein A0H81_07676 [Grifola frondosa]